MTQSEKIRGVFVSFRLDERTGKLSLPLHAPRHNDWVDSWGIIAVQCCAKRNLDYALSGMYIEYENVADPDDVISAPTVEHDAGISYYDALAGSPTRDILRIPLQWDPTLSVATGFADILGDTGFNEALFTAQTAGTEGVHGLPFSSASNSKVFGLALVAMPVREDATQDIVFARAYHDVSEQVIKQPSEQIVIAYKTTFTI